MLQDDKFRQSLCNMLCGTQRNTVTNGGRSHARNGTAVTERRKSRCRKLPCRLREIS